MVSGVLLERNTTQKETNSRAGNAMAASAFVPLNVCGDFRRSVLEADPGL